MEKTSQEFVAVFERVGKEYADMFPGSDCTVEELLRMQDVIRFKTNLTKTDQELTDEEGAWKIFYEIGEGTLEKILGADKKREIDPLRDNSYRIRKFQEAIKLLATVGPRIEQLFLQQFDTLAFHGDQKGNEYRVREAKFSSLMLDKTLPDEKHKEYAHAVIEFADKYTNGPITTLKKVNDEIQDGLVQCEKALSVVPEQTDQDFIPIFENLKRWLSLSKELHLSRVMATNSIIMQVEFDKKLPTLVIENNGRADLRLSREESEKYKEGLATYTSWMAESFATNERIQSEREPLAKELFPAPVEHNENPEPGGAPNSIQDRKVVSVHPLEGKAWFRLFKVVYILFWVAGLGFSVFVGIALNDFATFLISALIVSVLLFVALKVFYYVTLGRTTAREAPGKGFVDLDDLREDLAMVQANSPDLYNEIVAPYLASWQKQYGRRIPAHAINALWTRMDIEANSLNEKRHKIAFEAAQGGAKIEISKLREDMEKAKIEYKGPNRQGTIRAMDKMLLKLEAKYGTAIPADEAMKLLDEMEKDERAK